MRFTNHNGTFKPNAQRCENDNSKFCQSKQYMRDMQLPLFDSNKNTELYCVSRINRIKTPHNT
jgi:hypothetical protein